MKKNRIVRFIAVLIAGLAIVSAIAYGIYAFRPKAESATAVEDKNSKVDNVAVDSLENLKLTLTINLDQETLNKMFTEFKKNFLDNSMPTKNGKRTAAASKVGWDKEGKHMYDAVSFPFSTVEKSKKKYSNEDIESMYTELKDEIMRNPVMGDMILQGMAQLKLSDGTKISNLNAWTKDFLKIYKQYGCGAFLTYHTKYWEKHGFELPHDGEDIEVWKKAHPDAPAYSSEDLELVKDSQGSNKLYVTDYYSDTAKRILAWLDRCQLVGVETYSTVKHFPLKNVENANKVRTYLNKDKSYVDSAPALIFTVTLKNKTQLLFGFNVYDKRFEIFEKPAKIEKKKKGNPNPKGEDNPKPDKGKKKKPEPEPKKDEDPKPDKGDNDPTPDKTPTPNPVIPTPIPDPTPTPNPNPVPDGKKDPKKDPVHQGNANTGGGEGIGKTPDKPVPDPSKSDMQNAQNGEDRNQGHSDPKTVIPAAPEPPKDSGKIDKVDERKMNYGEEDHKQKDSVTDKNGNVSNPDEQPAAGEFSEPGL